jgi:hypothetical protein
MISRFRALVSPQNPESQMGRSERRRRPSFREALHQIELFLHDSLSSDEFQPRSVRNCAFRCAKWPNRIAVATQMFDDRLEFVQLLRHLRIAKSAEDGPIRRSVENQSEEITFFGPLAPKPIPQRSLERGELWSIIGQMIVRFYGLYSVEGLTMSESD